MLWSRTSLGARGRANRCRILWVRRTPDGALPGLRRQLRLITIAPRLSLGLHCCRAGGGLARCKCMGGAAWVRLGHRPRMTRRERRSRFVSIRHACLDRSPWALRGHDGDAAVAPERVAVVPGHPVPGGLLHLPCLAQQRHTAGRDQGPLPSGWRESVDTSVALRIGAPVSGRPSRQSAHELPQGRCPGHGRRW